MTRRTKVLIWIGALGAGVIGLLLFLTSWSTGTRLERRLAALRKAGEPVQLADLARKPIPPETNAATFLSRAADDFKAMQAELVAWYPETGYPTGEISAADQKRLADLFAAHPEVFPLLDQAAACPDYDPELDCTVPPSQFLNSQMDRLASLRESFRILRARSAWLVAQGRRDDALATTLTMLRLARHLEREPLVMGYMVSMACRALALQGANDVLQAGPVKASSRRALDAELDRHDNLDAYRWAIRSERAYALSALNDLPGANMWILRSSAKAGSLELLEVTDRYVANASKSYRDAMADQAALTAAAPSGWGIQRTLVQHMKPALNTAREPAERSRAMTRSLRVLNAIQARGTDQDQAPALSRLGLPSESTTDPYSGEPLKGKKLPGGWAVYAVGKNLVDDGGKLDGQTDVGVGPIQAKEKDEAAP